MKGDFASPTFGGDGATRAGVYLQADGKDMTDLWVFDYMDGECVQTLHQTQADGDAWGKPSMSLKYGQHHVYFVASRGDSPVVNETAHTITWTRPSDTFWTDYAVDVVSTSNGNRAVTLGRVATKLQITVNDEVPEACASVVITPAKWFYGWDYVGGVAVVQQQTERAISVPASMVGTSGVLKVAIFGLSGGDEWTTDVVLAAKDADGVVLGSVTITDAPFKANRSTEYSGNLFGSSGEMSVSLGDTWTDAVVGAW